MILLWIVLRSWSSDCSWSYHTETLCSKTRRWLAFPENMLTYKLFNKTVLYVRSFLTYSLHVLQMIIGSIYSTTSGVIYADLKIYIDSRMKNSSSSSHKSIAGLFPLPWPFSKSNFISVTLLLLYYIPFVLLMFLYSLICLSWPAVCGVRLKKYSFIQ